MTERITETELLTDDMIKTLLTEAGHAGDLSMEAICEDALEPASETSLSSRQDVARVITDARAMDESAPFIVVVA